MTPQPFTKPIAAVLLDIEGTTTPIDFVYSILFPYARTRVRNYVADHRLQPEVLADLSGLIAENVEDTSRGLDPPQLNTSAEQASIDAVDAYVRWLMDQDRKSTALKSLQGKIWDEGYRKGELRSQVFEDVPRAFRRWRKSGQTICIYSSGSVLAQKLLFANTDAGNLTPFISDYYDTNIGAKKDPDSYRRIAVRLKLDSSAILFVSDVADELNAAAAAGLHTLLCARPGNQPQPSANVHAIIRSFDEVLP